MTKPFSFCNRMCGYIKEIKNNNKIRERDNVDLTALADGGLGVGGVGVCYKERSRSYTV